MLSKRFYGAALMGAIVVTSGLEGCSSDSPLCCNEFKVGANIDAKIGGNAQSQVAVQAVADFAGIAGAAVDDLTTACRSMAQDLDAAKTDVDAAEANTDKTAKMQAYCALAVKAIGTIKAKAGGTLTISAKAPQCSASISAKANCQAKCSVDGKCDVKANPPKCTGGSLEVSCKGECTAKAGATLKCEGSCSATCKGSCTVKGDASVKCNGKCNGTCKAAAGGSGNGLDAQGNCTGECSGTCEVTAPEAKCEGSCQGECGGSCTGSAEASVKCDGECKADYEPLKCEGGKLEGGCQVDAKCDGNCDASVSAKAECTPPEIVIAFSGTADITAAGKLEATFKANLGVVLAFKSRLEAMGKLTATLTGNVSAVTDIKAACIPAVVAAAGDAAGQVTATAKATVDITAAAGAS